MSFPLYPKYKASGVEWLGNLPEHWEVKPLRSVFKFSKGLTITKEDLQDDGVYCVNYGEIHSKYGFRLNPTIHSLRCVSAEYLDSNPDALISDGDFVFADTSEDLEGSGNFTHLRYDREVFAGYHTIIARPRKSICSLFLAYKMHSSIFRSQIQSQVKGVKVFSISQGLLKSIQCWLPSLSEQYSIAEFLETETAKIDELIAEQRRLIELLNEKIISLVLSAFHAPATTEMRLSEASTIISRPVIQKVGEFYTRIGLFNKARGLFHKDASETEDMGESDFFWIEEGDLIISGQFAWEGAVALAGDKDTGCVVSHRYPVIRGKNGVVLTEYLFGLLCSKHGDFLLNQNSRGAAGRNRPLNISLLMKEKIPVPSMEVQKAVAQAVLNRKALVKEIVKVIELLHERRTALISVAVTGQIDVRQVAGV